MNRSAIVVMTAVFSVSLAAPALAYRCPVLVKECRATADIVAAREGTDKAAVEEARKRCDEALRLHETGQHKESQIEAGEAIADVSRALK
jgi:hypothetical protein